MPLSPDDRFGPYTLIAPLGEGGMGEVWKARDTRLDRTVALKVSKAAFTERFEREARAVAALNHPHICTLHDVGPNYLVMEYIEGAPLKGPLPAAQAVDYAGQILEALDAAHSKGITHRDLKPANILLTKQSVKLLDFGLAKQSASLPQDGATLTRALSSQGQILGTLQYMSPEQLQGKDADARSDLFAFGCVLYEMLAGKRAFDGENAASVIAAILEREPPSIAAVAPPALDRLVSRCLAKDPEQRWQSARDLRGALDLAMAPEARAPVRRARPFPWIVATAVLAAVAAAALWTLWREPAPEARALQFHVDLPAGAEFVLANNGNAISPDGRTIAFVAAADGLPRIWLQTLDSLATRAVPGTEGGQYPFWSPDSRSLGFFANGKLKRIDPSGGPPAILADAPIPRGGAWSEDGAIVFAPSAAGGLQRVAATGGAPAAFTQLDSSSHELTHRWPQFLPGDRHFLYSNQSADGRYRNYWASVHRPRERRALIETAGPAIYVRPRLRYPGYLLWLQQGSILAQTFDPDRGELSGEPLVVPGAQRIAFLFGNYPPSRCRTTGRFWRTTEATDTGCAG